MTTADAVRRMLLDAPGEALCDSCLAFACSTSLPEIREVTEQLLSDSEFQRAATCASCRRSVSAIVYSRKKCVYCSHPVLPRDNALVTAGDLFHAVCFKLLASDENIRVSRRLHEESRRLIERARRQLREQRERRSTETASD